MESQYLIHLKQLYFQSPLCHCFQLSKWHALKAVSFFWILTSRASSPGNVCGTRLLVLCAVLCACVVHVVCGLCCACCVLCALWCVGSQCVIWKRVDICIVNQTKQRQRQRCKHRELNLLQFTARSSSANLPVWEESNLHWFTASAFHAELLQWVSFAYKDLKTVATFLLGLQFYRRVFQHSSTFLFGSTKTIFKYIQA